MNQGEKKDYIVVSSMHFVTGVNQKFSIWLAVFWLPITNSFLPLPSKGEVLASPLQTAVLHRPVKMLGNFQVTIKLPIHIFDLVVAYNLWAIAKRTQKTDNKLQILCV